MISVQVHYIFMNANIRIRGLRFRVSPWRGGPPPSSWPALPASAGSAAPYPEFGFGFQLFASRVSIFRFRMSGFGRQVQHFGFSLSDFGRWGMGFGVLGLVSKVFGVRFGVWCLGFVVKRSAPPAPAESAALYPACEFRVSNFRLRVSGFDFRFSGLRVRHADFGLRMREFRADLFARLDLDAPLVLLILDPLLLRLLLPLFLHLPLSLPEQ